MKNDLVGQRFGKLLVISETTERSSNGSIKWLCKCDCGTEKVIAAKNLVGNKAKSCGCLNRATKNVRHGLSREKAYSIWNAMMSRCYNSNSKSYCNYGQRGIAVCEAWHDPSVFVEWSKRSGYKEGLTIDRIDVNGNYSPENCRWIPRSEQMSNMSTNHLVEFGGKTQTIAQWSRETGIKPTTIMMRLNKYHWSAEKTLTTKVNK